ncbi:protein hold'em [Episyrphus balteatus]|uniref:protein hold'em n=1 Tax=Episyrphus balteatus TaxID=286459 RepID=UPI0024859339|nr:protein hold'em [Episyrphus balteatus]
MASVSRKKLSDLILDEPIDFVVTALILSKTDPNIFQQKESTEQRGVILFTIRDGKKSITNCKCWASKEKIEEYHRKFNINDVIDIICARVVPIRNNEQEQHFQPTVTLPFQLVLNEGIGFIEEHVGDTKELLSLSRLSIRPLSSVLNLSDISSTNVNFKGHYVDLLVIIALMKPVKEVRAKSGYPLKCLELVVIDKSLPSGMVLTIWNSSWIERSQKNWKQMKTILHLIDARVGYQEFHKTTTLGLSSRSLVFENPVGKEMEVLAEYANNTPSVDLDIFGRSLRDTLPDPSSIKTPMTVRQIYDHAEASTKEESDEFTAVLLATVTKLDLDGYTSVIAKKCQSCGHRMLRDQYICDNEQCQMSFSFNYSGDKFTRFIDINIHFSDHTGTLVESRITGAIADQIFKTTTDEFVRSNDKQKETLKWKFLLERFEVKLLVKKPTPVRQNLYVQVIDMQKLSLKEFSERIAVY